MKHFMFLAVLSLLFSSFTFAEEVETDCPYMAELNSRLAGKRPADVQVEKPRTESSGAVAN